MNGAQLITFVLGDWTFGMPLSCVIEVQRASELESLSVGGGGPMAMLRWRDETLPVWDLRALLGLSEGAPREPFVVIASVETGKGAPPVKRAWMVDAATEVVDLSQGQPVALSGTPVDAWTTSVLRYGPTLVFVLDPVKLAGLAQPGAVSDAEASALASLAAATHAAPPQKGEELVVFVVGWQRYALPVAWIREIQPVGELTPIPCVPPFVRGVMNLRGGLLSVIDLHAFLDVKRPGMEEAARVLVLDAPEFEIGIAAREVVGLVLVPEGGKLAPMPAPGGVPARFLDGMLEDLTLVLDAEALLADPKLVVDDSGAVR